MPPPRALVPAVLIALALAAPGGARAGEATQDYVVQPGDSCMSIAVKVLGDARALGELHRLNPQLGPDTPHVLVPGQVLALPRADRGPDARLTGKSGDVRVRPAAATAWDDARRGMDLFRAWRVGAEARASAEVTYTDDQQRLQLREHTVVVIYGPERRRARSGAEVVIERGALRTRLGELSGKRAAPLRVETPSATAALGAGRAVVAVADDGLSTVANHAGAAIDLRGKAGGRVAVASGMGTRVATGARPEPPRPLPAAPAWIAGPAGFVAIDGAAELRAAWEPRAGVASYRVELVRGTALVAAAEVPAAITHFELHGAPPGDYVATIASIDGDRLEGEPGPPLPITVRGVAIVPPGADAPAATPPAADDEPIAPTPSPMRRVALGSRVIADGLLCEAGRAPATVAILDTAGAIALRCTGPGGDAFAPLPLGVAAVEIAAAAGTGTVTQGRAIRLAITLRSDGALGDAWQLEPSPGLTVEGVTRTADGLAATVLADDDAPAASALRVVDATTQRTAGTVAIEVVPRARTASTRPGPDPGHPTDAGPTGSARSAPPPAPSPFFAGGYAGALYFNTGLDGNTLGNPALDDYQAEGGAAVGLRAGWWSPRSVLFAEVDLAAIPTRFAGADEAAWIYGAHAQGGLVLARRGGLRAYMTLGAGLLALRTDAIFAEDDVDLDGNFGAGLAYFLDRRVRVRLDSRVHAVYVKGSRSTAVDDDLSVYVGVGINAGVDIALD